MKVRRLIAAAVVAAAVLACAPMKPAGLSDADKAAIRAVTANTVKIGNTQPLDAEAYVKSYHTDEGMFMPPNAKALTGHAEMVAWFKPLPPISGFMLNAEEIEGTGDVAWVRGTYSFTMSPPGAPQIVDAGKYLEVWKRQTDGSWRVTRDIFNSDLPVAPAAPAPKKK